MDWGSRTITSLEKIRHKKPLIHNLTNFVVMNSTANAILAIGASPVMAHAKEEVEEMASIASAVVLNIGTLEPSWVEAMIIAGKTANKKEIPVIFDPVGVGATTFRNESAQKILSEVKCSIIRGNASEIYSLAGFESKTKGVDSLIEVTEIATQMRGIAKKLHSVIAVTGVEDMVCDGNVCLGISGGDSMFKRVTGTGCAASAICACFAAVESKLLDAATEALAYYGIAGMEAAYHSKGPGSFQVELYNALANLEANTVLSSIMVREV
ncbi:hydroxyethylthiazole kinase [bacterium]|nr:hydroxyethylthiazole kinase [candidate division CSSED10-310 bacterium]